MSDPVRGERGGVYPSEFQIVDAKPPSQRAGQTVMRSTKSAR